MTLYIGTILLKLGGDAGLLLKSIKAPHKKITDCNFELIFKEATGLYLHLLSLLVTFCIKDSAQLFFLIQ